MHRVLYASYTSHYSAHFAAIHLGLLESTVSGTELFYKSCACVNVSNLRTDGRLLSRRRSEQTTWPRARPTGKRHTVTSYWCDVTRPAAATDTRRERQQMNGMSGAMELAASCCWCWSSYDRRVVCAAAERQCSPTVRQMSTTIATERCGRCSLTDKRFSTRRAPVRAPPIPVRDGWADIRFADAIVVSDISADIVCVRDRRRMAAVNATELCTDDSIFSDTFMMLLSLTNPGHNTVARRAPDNGPPKVVQS